MESILQKRGVRLTLLILVCAGAIYGAYQLSAIFAPLLFSFIIAYVLDPVADALERRKFTRLAAVITIFLVGAFVVLAVFAVSGIYVTRAVDRLVYDIQGDPTFEVTNSDSGLLNDPALPEGMGYRDENENDKFDRGYFKRTEEFLTEFIEGDDESDARISWAVPYLSAAKSWIREKREEFGPSQATDEEIQAAVKAKLNEIWQKPIAFITGSEKESAPADVNIQVGEQEKEKPGVFSRVFKWLSWMLLCPLYIFYLLLEIDPLKERIRKLLPGKQRPRIVRILSKIDQTMAAFFRGRLTICVVKGIGTSIGLLILGVPFALPLGLAAGFLALIPYVGIWFAIIPSLTLAWLDSSGSFGYLLGVAAVFIVMEVLEGFVMIPKFLGKEVGLHPLTVIVTMLIFAELLGFLGVLLSVPLAAIAKILLEEFVMPLVEEFAAETPDEKEPEPSG